MAPEQFEKIALWMGWEKGCDHWVSLPGVECHGLVATKTSLTDSEAVEALKRLANSG